jgi:type IV pilus assembly protein PilM
MPVQHGVWGIDVGQAALKALRLEMIDGAVTATAFDYVEHPKILSQPDADPDQLTREALEKFLSRNDIKGDFIAISVPGQSGLARFVKLPPVEEKKIGDIVRFEAKQQIPFPLEEVVWDFQKIGAGEVTDGFAMETEIGLFAMKRDQIARSLAHFQDVNIEVHAIQMAPLALCNFVTYDLLNKGGQPASDAAAETAAPTDGPRGKKQCVVALDIGTDSSNLVITDGEKIIWQRPIPLGGNHLTRALSKELKLTFAKAEHLKRNAAKSPPELKTILSALKPVLTDFVGEVQRSLGFFTNSHRDSQVQYMVGLGSAFRLPGLQKYLSEKLQLDVRKPSRMNRLIGETVTEAPVFVENVLSFAVPYGLAIQGLGLAKLQTNLLPQEIQRERMIRAKKPWAVAAAAALFLGAGAIVLGYAMNYRAVHAKSIDDELKRVASTASEVNARNSEAAKETDNVNQLTAAVKGVIAGKDEQLNWIRLNEYISRCLPQPDGTNLKSRGKTLDEARPINQFEIWNTAEAQEAMRQYYDRVRGGQSADSPIPEKIRQDLVLVDLEAIDSRWCDNLKNFFDNAQRISRDTYGQELSGMLKYDKDNPPKDGDKGWIIELRGSTYNKNGRIFLKDTLVHNLTYGLPYLNPPLKVRETIPFVGEAAPAAPPGGAPPGGAAPGGAPPGGAPPAGGGAAGGGPPAPTGSDPIVDRISHILILNVWTVHNPQPGTVQNVGSTYLPSVLTSFGGFGMGDAGGGAPGAPGAPGGGPPGAPGGARGDESGMGMRGGPVWAPLSGSDAGGGFGAPGGGGFGGPDGPPRGFGGGGMGRGEKGDRGDRGPAFPPGGVPGMPGAAPGGVPGPNQPGVNQEIAPRYEFVVMFIWREPTPSDALIPGGADAGGVPGGPPLNTSPTPTGGAPVAGAPPGGPPPIR